MKFPNLWKVVGGIPTEKYESQLGVLFPTEWKNNPNVPNHQPEVDDLPILAKKLDMFMAFHGYLKWSERKYRMMILKLE